MKKAFDWFIKFLGAVFITVTVVPVMLGLLLGMIFVFCVGVLGMDPGPDRDARAVAALEGTGLSAYTVAAPYHAMTVDDSLTAFVTFQYDNHEDNTNLWDGIMSAAADLPNWHVEALPCDAYTAKLNAVFPEAAFLLPLDVTFDAWYASTDSTAFFDQDTGLFVFLRKGGSGTPGSIRADRLTVPHSGFVYEMETHGGFHGDGDTYYALIVPEDERPALEKALAAHADWHEGVITSGEYRQLHDQRFYAALPLYPAADVTFEWCSFVDTYARSYPDEEPYTDREVFFPAALQESGACWSMNWLCALYDPDTGLFIFYQYDS